MRKRRSRPWLPCFLGREASLQCPGCRAPAPPHCLAFEEMLRPVLNCERGAVASQGSHQSSLGQSLRRNYRATASSETRICGLSPSAGLRPECSKGRWAGFGVWSVLGRTRATSHRQIAHVVQSTSRFLICTPCCSEASKTRTRGSAPDSARHCSAMRDFFFSLATSGPRESAAEARPQASTSIYRFFLGGNTRRRRSRARICQTTFRGDWSPSVPRRRRRAPLSLLCAPSASPRLHETETVEI